MMKKLIINFLILFLCMPKLQAQQVEKGFELMEVLKIAEAYKQTPNLSFSIEYTYADSAQPSTVLEQMAGSSKMSDGRYWSMLDSVEFLQGYQYNLTIYHRDSTIIVNEPQVYPDVMKMPTMDSLFQQQVDSMQLIELNDSTRQLSLYFNPAFPYSLYKLQYDKNNFRISSIEYYIRNVPPESGGIGSGTALVKIAISDYLDSPIDPSTFLEDKFIYKLNGELYPKPSYSDFKLYSNISTKFR